ncbi:hypothetical protein CGRA01v4_02623 [Colletotrichum graminicola]|nr:hypothetical protein CGRA01v4_02623 [Colletotrichum graminicola]
MFFFFVNKKCSRLGTALLGTETDHSVAGQPALIKQGVVTWTCSDSGGRRTRATSSAP